MRHGAEVINACRTEFENKMAAVYAENYGLLPFAGSDNHIAGEIACLAGMSATSPISDEQDFIERVKNGKMNIFTLDNQH